MNLLSKQKLQLYSAPRCFQQRLNCFGVIFRHRALSTGTPMCFYYTSIKPDDNVPTVSLIIFKCQNIYLVLKTPAQSKKKKPVR